MRIAIVGKWWSGKTTISALMTSYLLSCNQKVLLIDADLNMHLSALFLEQEKFNPDKYLSTSENSTKIKTYLIWNNHRITSLAAFRKTTPPTKESQLFILWDEQNPLYNFSEKVGNLSLMVVGSYTSAWIGASCYHNNLAILENLLSHMDDRNEKVIVDMVAGVDAFASSLYMQFDMLLLVVEPTQKGIAVWNDYAELAQASWVYDQLFVLGNKSLDESDYAFLKANLPAEKLLWIIGNSPYLRAIEKNWNLIDFSQLEESNQEVFPSILAQLAHQVQPLNQRLEKLYLLHKKYVAQDFIVERFGDLTQQIDSDFRFDE